MNVFLNEEIIRLRHQVKLLEKGVGDLEEMISITRQQLEIERKYNLELSNVFQEFSTKIVPTICTVSQLDRSFPKYFVSYFVFCYFVFNPFEDPIFDLNLIIYEIALYVHVTLLLCYVNCLNINENICCN